MRLLTISLAVLVSGYMSLNGYGATPEAPAVPPPAEAASPAVPAPSPPTAAPASPPPAAPGTPPGSVADSPGSTPVVKTSVIKELKQNELAFDPNLMVLLFNPCRVVPCVLTDSCGARVVRVKVDTELASAIGNPSKFSASVLRPRGELKNQVLEAIYGIVERQVMEASTTLDDGAKKLLVSSLQVGGLFPAEFPDIMESVKLVTGAELKDTSRQDDEDNKARIPMIELVFTPEGKARMGLLQKIGFLQELEDIKQEGSKIMVHPAVQAVKELPPGVLGMLKELAELQQQLDSLAKELDTPENRAHTQELATAMEAIANLNKRLEDEAKQVDLAKANFDQVQGSGGAKARKAQAAAFNAAQAELSAAQAAMERTQTELTEMQAKLAALDKRVPPGLAANEAKKKDIENRRQAILDAPAYQYFQSESKRLKQVGVKFIEDVEKLQLKYNQLRKQYGI